MNSPNFYKEHGYRNQIEYAEYMLKWCDLPFEQQVAADPTHTDDKQGRKDIEYYRKTFTKILKTNTKRLEKQKQPD